MSTMILKEKGEMRGILMVLKCMHVKGGTKGERWKNKRSWMVFWKRKGSRWEKEEGTHTHTPQILEQKGEDERDIDGSNLLTFPIFFEVILERKEIKYLQPSKLGAFC